MSSSVRGSSWNGGRLVAASVLLVVLVALAGCAGGGPSTSTSQPVTTSAVGGSSTTASASPLSARIVLSSRTVVAGGTLSGRVVVDNDTGTPVHVTGCGTVFAVRLTSATYVPKVAWPTCAERITIPVGRSSYPVTVPASYDGCVRSGPRGGLPACLPDGHLPPLPAGHYEAKLFQSSNVVPAPAPVPVQVTSTK